MRTIQLEDLIKQARPLPWPVNGKVISEGGMTPEQLEATRILRRHAANQLKFLVESLRAQIETTKQLSNQQAMRDDFWHGTTALSELALEHAEKVQVEE